MRWIADNTGRFPQRPHYERAELDRACEKLVTEVLVQKHSKVIFPIPTDDLTVLIERDAADLNMYADLSGEDGDPEGVTNFFPGYSPKVRIASKLSENDYREHRLRTTLAHEYAHVMFHAPLYEIEHTPSLFGSQEQRPAPKCHRDTLLGKGTNDWLEWQAGYCCGALLMPITHLHHVVEDKYPQIGIYGASLVSSSRGQSIVSEVGKVFDVSREAARVRLEQLGILQNSRNR